MQNHLRDLGSSELWQSSLDRSRKRRVLAHDGRRRTARRKQASGAVTAAMLLTPVLQVGGVAAKTRTGKSDVGLSSPANRAIGGRTLRVTLVEGATGARVAQLQQLLGVDVDGIFGPRTAAAVRGFQAREGLAVDGVVGASTWRALLGSGAGRSRDVAAADSVVDGRGYQVTVGRASRREAKLAGDGDGTVAKIVLTRGPKRAKAEPESRSAPVKDGASSSQPATEPAVDTGADEPVACGSAKLVNPVKGAVQTSPFGPRGGRNHDGVDLAAPTGTPVHAAACGVVTTIGQQSGYGNIVCIDHGSGFTTCYAHLSRFSAHQGEQVHAGDVIGYVGATGDATGPHLHFETRVNGQARNPQPYLSGSQRAPASHAKARAASVDAAPAKASSSRSHAASSTTRSPAAHPQRGTTRGGVAPQTSGGAHHTETPAKSSAPEPSTARTPAPADASASQTDAPATAPPAASTTAPEVPTAGAPEPAAASAPPPDATASAPTAAGTGAPQTAAPSSTAPEGAGTETPETPTSRAPEAEAPAADADAPPTGADAPQVAPATPGG